MRYSATLCGKPIMLELSDRAEAAIAGRDSPLVADIHLVFGCMVIKRVWFPDRPPPDTVFVTDRLGVSFNVVRYTKTCRIADIDNGAIPEDFPLVRDRKSFVPDYLFIDYAKGGFSGDYTYDGGAGQRG